MNGLIHYLVDHEGPSEDNGAAWTTAQMHLNAINQKKKQDKLLSSTYLFNNHAAACDKYEDLERMEKIPANIYVVVFHRRFTKQELSLFADF